MESLNLSDRLHLALSYAEMDLQAYIHKASEDTEGQEFRERLRGYLEDIIAYRRQRWHGETLRTDVTFTCTRSGNVV